MVGIEVLQVCYLRVLGPVGSVQSCSIHRSGRMGSISGRRSVSLDVLLGDGPLEHGLWKDSLKRDAPEKEGAAIPGECERLETDRRTDIVDANRDIQGNVIYSARATNLRAAMLDMLGE